MVRYEGVPLRGVLNPLGFVTNHPSTPYRDIPTGTPHYSSRREEYDLPFPIRPYQESSQHQ